MRRSIILLALAALVACSPRASDQAAPASLPQDVTVDPSALATIAAGDAAAAAGDAAAALAPVWTPPAYSGASFNGYDCTENCEGHEAGYEWAEQNEIEDESDCSTASNSFNEGCTSWVEERAAAEEERQAEEEDANSIW